MYGGLRQELGEVHGRVRWRRGLSRPPIPPKYSVAQVSASRAKVRSTSREFAGRSRNFVGQHFWARG